MERKESHICTKRRNSIGTNESARSALTSQQDQFAQNIKVIAILVEAAGPRRIEDDVQGGIACPGGSGGEGEAGEEELGDDAHGRYLWMSADRKVRK